MLPVLVLVAGLVGLGPRAAKAVDAGSTLTVKLTGTGSGTAAGSPYLSFPVSGSVSGLNGTSVTLSALPAANSVLESWSGCDLVSGAVADLMYWGSALVKGNDLYISGTYSFASSVPQRIYKIDTVSGAVRSILDTKETYYFTMLGFNGYGSLIVIRWNTSARMNEVGTLNTSTGTFTQLHPPFLQSFLSDGYAMKGNAAYFIGDDVNYRRRLFNLDTVYGRLTATPIDEGLSIAGFRSDGRLVAIRWNAASSREEFGVVDTATGAFSFIGVLGDLRTYYYKQMKMRGNVLYVLGDDAGAHRKLYAVDTVTGTVLGSPAVSNGMYPDFMAGFNSAGNLIGMHWNPAIGKEETGVLDPATGEFTVSAASCTVLVNTDRTVTATFAKDTSAPEIKEFALTTPVRSLTIPVTAFTATDKKGVTGYMITTTATPPQAAAAAWRTAPPATVSVPSAGVKTLYAWARNVVGNVSAPATATVNVDMTPPVVTSFTTPTTAATLDVPITSFSATDATGVTGYAVTTTATAPLATSTAWKATPPASVVFTSAGTRKLYAWARDAVGNVSAAKAATVVVDPAPPTVATFSVGAANKSLTFPIAVTASDNIRVAGYLVTESPEAPTASSAGWQAAAPRSYSTLTTGRKTLYAWAKDAAGNVSASKSASTVVDMEAPQISLFAAPPLLKTLRVPVTTFTVQDPADVSGYLITLTADRPAANAVSWRATVPAAYTATSAGTKTLYAWVKDAAGNVSDSASATVRIDLTPPVVTAFTVPRTANSLTVPITSFTASDASGIAGYLITTSYLAPPANALWSATPPTSYSFSSTGSKALYAWARDSAGNVSPARVATTLIPAAIVTSISGQVNNLAGTGLANIPVSLYSASGSTLLRAGTTSAGGAYSFTGLESGSYKIFFDGSATGYQRTFFNGNLSDIGSAGTIVLTPPTAATGVNATLAPAGGFSGKVTDQAGAPLSGIGVKVFHPNGIELWRSAVVTGADGSYTIKGLASGSYKVQFDGGDAWGSVYYGGKFDLDVSVAAAVTAGLTTAGIDAVLDASETAAISGRVGNGSDAGVPGATVSLYTADTGSFVKSASTGATGLYQMGGVRSGDYKILFAAGSQGYGRSFYGGEKFDPASAATVTVTAPNNVQGIDGALEAGGSLTGRVTNGGGAGLGGVWVYAQLQDGPLIAGVARRTDANGYCTIDGLPPGNYSVMLESEGGMVPGQTSITVTAGPVPAVFSAAMPLFH